MKIITAFVSLNSILTVKIFLQTDINKKKKSVKLQKKKHPHLRKQTPMMLKIMETYGGHIFTL